MPAAETLWGGDLHVQPFRDQHTDAVPRFVAQPREVEASSFPKPMLRDYGACGGRCGTLGEGSPFGSYSRQSVCAGWCHRRLCVYACVCMCVCVCCNPRHAVP